jgi:hypothetical protein
MSSERLERVLAGEYASGLEDLTIDEVRARRHECQEIEVGLSYARRMVQGRLDIIHAELERRQSGGGRSDPSELVERLSAMLGEQTRPAGFGRLPTMMAPDQASDEFSGEIDEIADPQSLATLPELSDDVIGKLADRLTTLERSLSERRRSVFDRIDAFQGEIVRRYKTGSANPDELLA